MAPPCTWDISKESGDFFLMPTWVSHGPKTKAWASSTRNVLCFPNHLASGCLVACVLASMPETAGKVHETKSGR